MSNQSAEVIDFPSLKKIEIEKAYNTLKESLDESRGYISDHDNPHLRVAAVMMGEAKANYLQWLKTENRRLAGEWENPSW